MRFGPCLVALAVMTSMPVTAMVPPLPPEHARYGPLTQCFAGYAIRIAENEAVMVNEDRLTVQGESRHLVARRDYHMRPAGAPTIKVKGLGTVTRYGNGGGIPAHPEKVEYEFPARAGDRPIVVQSEQFDGSQQDMAILRQFQPLDPSDFRCSKFGLHDYEGEDRDAFTWSPVKREGPGFECLNGIGLAIRPGERFQISWLPGFGLRIGLAPNDIQIFGPFDWASRPGSGRGPIDARYQIGHYPIDHPALRGELQGMLLKPQSSKGVRDHIGLAYRKNQTKDAIQLAGRLEFVEKGDPRCS